MGVRGRHVVLYEWGIIWGRHVVRHPGGSESREGWKIVSVCYNVV